MLIKRLVDANCIVSPVNTYFIDDGYHYPTFGYSVSPVGSIVGCCISRPLGQDLTARYPSVFSSTVK